MAWRQDIRGGEMKRYGMVFLLLLLAGCNKMHANRSGINFSEECTYKTYTLGKDMTAFIGQPLAQWEPSLCEKQLEAFTLNEDMSLTGTYNTGWADRQINIRIKKGDVLYLSGTYNGRYIARVKDSTGEEYGILFNDDGTVKKDTVTNDDLDHYYVSTNAKMIPDQPSTTKVFSDTTYRGKALTRELIYAGINNVTINVTYREFSRDDLARPAFFQNLVYPTSADSIRFQNLKIKINDVSNEKITYTVVED